MSITELWRKSPQQIHDKHVFQIIGFCGDGRIRDGSPTSNEFRNYLNEVPSQFLVRYADECLSERFDNNGLVLQDVVNEIGRRLGFEVENGRYRGTQHQIGNDGLWRSDEGESIIVEVKTTDAYRIDLDAIAGYRNALIKEAVIPEDKSSALIIVGREDTGGLEAQIRGSRHAWDIRLISIDALNRLMRLREEVEDPSIMRKITSILLPHEYTKVDGIIDIVFSAAEDVRQEVVETEVPRVTEVGLEDTGRALPVSFHDACVKRISAHLEIVLVRRSRAIYSSVDGSTVVTCAVSREHDPTGSPNYWFAFHPHQAAILDAAKKSYVSFGCGSPELVVMVPYAEFKTWLDGMHQTFTEPRYYYHIEIYKNRKGELELRRSKTVSRIPLGKYVLSQQIEK